MTGYHMTPDEFRRHGHDLIDWLAGYMETVADRPITPQVRPGDIRELLPDDPPEEPEDFAAILRDLDDVVMPGITHWQSPGWFAFFPANTSPPSILGELAAAGLGVQGMNWATSPAATEIESHVLDWLVDLLGLPPGWKSGGPGGGVIQMSASDAAHVALVTARHRAGGPIGDQVAYASVEAHSSIEKGARIAGFAHFRAIPTDDRHAMSVPHLEQAIEDDLGAGLSPTFVNGTVGTTATTAVDPVRALGEVAQRHALWFHIDAAYAGTAMICPEFRLHQDGVELANSYNFNPHKWMFTNFDCSVFYVADRRPLLDALSILPPYLRNPATESGDVIDYRDWHVPLGRRFRALKLWFVLRSYGAAGIRHHVRRHVELAADFARRVDAHDRLVRVADVPFGLVCFRHADGNEATLDLAAAINGSGHSRVTASAINGIDFIRVSIGQTHTGQEHVDRLWRLVDDVASGHRT
jgi:aromatic-L-amino-acid decarboxylase